MKTFAKLAIYSRDEQGMITYCGLESWSSLHALLSHYFCDTVQPQCDTLLGWPHMYVTWYRHIGIGSNSAPTPPSPKVQGADSVAAAVNSGDATLSKITSISDAKTFVENSGVTNWKFTGRASAEGFAVWIRANRSEIDTENYAPELYEYLSSVGENPADYDVNLQGATPDEI